MGRWEMTLPTAVAMMVEKATRALTRRIRSLRLSPYARNVVSRFVTFTVRIVKRDAITLFVVADNA